MNMAPAAAQDLFRTSKNSVYAQGSPQTKHHPNRIAPLLEPAYNRSLSPTPKKSAEPILIEQHKYPDLYQCVNDVASKTGISITGLYLFDEPYLNAYGVSEGARKGHINFTRGFLDMYRSGTLTKDEFCAVVAHESGHIRNRHDTKLAISTVTVPPALFGVLYTIAHSAHILSNEFAVLASAFVATIGLASLLLKTISRKQEYSADRASALAVSSEQTISALRKTYERAQLLRSIFGKREKSMLEVALSFVCACPPKEKRIAALTDSSLGGTPI